MPCDGYENNQVKCLLRLTRIKIKYAAVERPNAYVLSGDMQFFENSIQGSKIMRCDVSENEKHLVLALAFCIGYILRDLYTTIRGIT